MSIPMRERVRPDFPAVVHTYTDALRVLREAPDHALTVGELAVKTDRVLSNVRRDLPKLRDAGVVTFVHGDDRAHLTEKGRRWLQGQDIAEGAAAAAADDGVLRLRHDQLRPDPTKSVRKVFDRRKP
jgi:DNA-binding transcriptional ArsR family regulator